MSALGLTLVIVCGGFFAFLVICGTADSLLGGVDLITVLISLALWIMFLGLVAGLLYGLWLLGVRP